MAKKFSIGVIIKGIDRATGPVRRISRSITASTGRITKSLFSAKTAIAGLATGVVAAKAVSAFNEYAEGADNLAKFSRQVGLSVQALQEYRHAANLAGVDQKVFDKLVARMTNRLGEMKAGMGEATTFLSRVAPDVLKQLKGAEGTEQALDIVIRAMERLEDPTKRAAFAGKIFGERLGLQMVRLADAGTESIKAARKEARDYGLVSEESAKQAEAWIDSMARFKLSIGGVVNSIGSRLVPALRPYLDQLTQWITKNREIIGQKIGDLIKRVADWVSSIDFRAIIRGAGTFFSAVGSILSTVNDLVHALGGWKTVLIAIGGIKLAGLISGLSAANPLMLAASAAIGSWAYAITTAIDAYHEWEDLKAAKERNKHIDQANEGMTEKLGYQRGAKTKDEALRLGRQAVGEATAERARLRREARRAGIDTKGKTYTELRQLLAERRTGSKQSQSSEVRSAVEAMKRQTGSAEITVKFEGTPPGVHVGSPRSTGPNPPKVKTRTGRRFAGAGGGW